MLIRYALVDRISQVGFYADEVSPQISVSLYIKTIRLINDDAGQSN